MSSSKDTPSKGPKQRPSDPALLPMRQASWRTGPVAVASGTTNDEVPRSPSNSSYQELTEEFLARGKQGGRNRNGISFTPTPGKEKKQGGGNKGSSSGTDDSGGVPLNADHNTPAVVANEKSTHGRAKDEQSPVVRSNNGSSSANGQFTAAPTPGFNVNTARSELSEQQRQGPMLNISESMSIHQTPGRARRSILPQSKSPYQTAQYRAILIDFEDTLTRIPDLSKSAFDLINKKFDKVLHDMSGIHHRLIIEIESHHRDQDKLRGRLHALLQQLDAVMHDRKRIANERDSYQIQVNEFALRAGDNIKPWIDLEMKLRKEIAEIREQMRLQDEQLKGRRSLLMDVNLNPASRRRAMSSNQDPFDTPLRSQNPGAGGSYTPGLTSQSASTPFTGTSRYTGQEGGGYQSRTIGANSTTPFAPPGLNRYSTALTSQGPSSAMRNQGEPFASPAPMRGNRGDNFASPNMQRGRGSRRRRNNQGHNPTTSNDVSDPNSTPASLRRYNTEPNPRTAMVPFAPEEDRYLEFKEGINMMYDLAQNWARTYAFHPDPAREQDIAMEDPGLWEFMMNCTFPGHRDESHVHVLTVLGDYSTRLWFVTRMALTYCIQEIMNVDAFKRFNPQMAEAIENAKVSRQERGLANDARQALVEYQVAAFESMLASTDYDVFRHAQLTDHTMRLREILGPMINMDTSLMQAYEELEAIVVTAWDQAVKMHTSHVTFQIYFPETSTKFSTATMVVVNSPEDPVTLQSAGARLKLVATPVITVRDDRNTGIIAKNLHKATVIVE